MKVYTQFDRPKTIPTNPGDGYLTEYQEQIDKKGQKEVVPCGEKNIYAMIQADLPQTLIENILHSVAMGDLEALNQRQGVYVDATEYPKNLMEAQNIVLKAKYEFERFPVEVKELFNNSADQYVAEMGSKEFFDKMSPYNEKIRQIEEAGSLAEYNKKVAAEAKFQNDVAAQRGATNEQKQ